jgi:hypothetical protein
MSTVTRQWLPKSKKHVLPSQAHGPLVYISRRACMRHHLGHHLSVLATTAALTQRVARRPFANVASWSREAEKDGVQFVGGYVSPKDMPRLTVPEFTLVGRSNVGKSSALNALSFRRKKVAVVSKTPGRTRMINLFKVGKACAITDLPGYGFAKVSKDLQDDWRKQIQAYLRHRENLRLAVLFVDSQIEPRPQDAQVGATRGPTPHRLSSSASPHRAHTRDVHRWVRFPRRSCSTSWRLKACRRSWLRPRLTN